MPDRIPGTVPLISSVVCSNYNALNLISVTVRVWTWLRFNNAELDKGRTALRWFFLCPLASLPLPLLSPLFSLFLGNQQIFDDRGLGG